MSPIHRLFYTIKPIIPRCLQIVLRRQIARYKRKKYAHVWPIDPDSGTPPEGWPGWPKGKKFALVLSHDVDTKVGHDNVMKLVELEEKLGFRSSFNFVPERYENSNSLHRILREKGFGIGVHGLKHDGKLFLSHDLFKKRSHRINHYLSKWNTTSFTSPSMHRNLDWMFELNITSSISTFDTDPFEPQPNGAGTIFPYTVKNGSKENSFLELPYTLPQDHLLFIILQEKDITIWKYKVDWIAAKGGMALLNTHSDYMNFKGLKCKQEQYPLDFYKNFLQYIKKKYAGQYWLALAPEIAKIYKYRR